MTGSQWKLPTALLAKPTARLSKAQRSFFMFYYWFSIGLTGPSKSFDGHQQKESQKVPEDPTKREFFFQKNCLFLQLAKLHVRQDSLRTDSIRATQRFTQERPFLLLRGDTVSVDEKLHPNCNVFFTSTSKNVKMLQFLRIGLFSWYLIQWHHCVFRKIETIFNTSCLKSSKNVTFHCNISSTLTLVHHLILVLSYRNCEEL